MENKELFVVAEISTTNPLDAVTGAASMTNPADTPEVHVDHAINGVVRDIQRLAHITPRWPYLVQEQLQDIEMARTGLTWVITYLKKWREAQKTDEPVDFLGAG